MGGNLGHIFSERQRDTERHFHYSLPWNMLQRRPGGGTPPCWDTVEHIYGEMLSWSWVRRHFLEAGHVPGVSHCSPAWHADKRGHMGHFTQNSSGEIWTVSKYLTKHSSRIQPAWDLSLMLSITFIHMFSPFLFVDFCSFAPRMINSIFGTRSPILIWTWSKCSNYLHPPPGLSTPNVSKGPGY